MSTAQPHGLVDWLVELLAGGWVVRGEGGGCSATLHAKGWLPMTSWHLVQALNLYVTMHEVHAELQTLQSSLVLAWGSRDFSRLY